MKNQKPGTFNIMRKFRIGEVSSVDMPAQGDGARVEIMKRADLEKKAAMTDPMDGHAHVLNGVDEHVSGQTSYSGNEGDHHSHDWLVGLNGEIIVGASNGHTHRVGFFGKHAVADVSDETHFTLEQMSASSKQPDIADQTPTEDSTMNETEFNEKLAEMQKSVEAANSRADSAEKVSALNDVQKAHYAGLEGDAASDFLKSDSKDADIAKAAELAKSSDPVVATDEDGTEILKSQDPTGRLTAAIEKAKHAKFDLAEMKEKAKKDKDEAKKSDLAKRAAELVNIPGTEDQRAEMLKAFDAIEDEDMRKAAHAALVAKNTELASAFSEAGSVGNPKNLSDDDAIAEMGKALQVDNPSLSDEQAYTKALISDEGQAIYNKRLEG